MGQSHRGRLTDSCSNPQVNQNKVPQRQEQRQDQRVISRGPDFTPAFADFSRQTPGSRGAPVGYRHKTHTHEHTHTYTYVNIHIYTLTHTLT